METAMSHRSFSSVHRGSPVLVGAIGFLLAGSAFALGLADLTNQDAARGIKGVDGARGPRFNQSSLVIEAAMNGRGVALAIARRSMPDAV